MSNTVLEKPASEVFRQGGIPAESDPTTEKQKPTLNALTIMRAQELEPMDKQSLIQLCEQRDLPRTGTKEALIERLCLWQELKDNEAAPLSVVIIEPEVEAIVPYDEDYSEAKGTLSLTAAELVLVCAAIHSPNGHAETYSIQVEKISDTEVILSKQIPGDQGSYRYKIKLPPRVQVKAQRH